MIGFSGIGGSKLKRSSAVPTRRGPTQNAQAIQKMVRRIVRQFAPDKIILFGSHARGIARPDSDVDILVVLPVDGSKRMKAVEIAVALRDIDVAKDIVVTTPEEYE